MSAKPCGVSGCQKPAKTRGMCGMHTERIRVYGTVDLPPRTTCSVADCGKIANRTNGLCQSHAARARSGLPFDLDLGVVSGHQFFERVHRGAPSECWEWTGYISQSGYGTYAGSYAHRISYLIHVGPIPDGFHLDHLCRNTTCVNPAHLEAVTPRVNFRRGVAIGAIATRTNKCMRGHEYTPDNTYVRPDGKGRHCRACVRLRKQMARAA